jgi:hypothetical protein
MGRSHRYIELDARRRIALNHLARHDLYLVQVDERGVITLTPAEVTPLVTPPPVRKKRAPQKKAAPAAAETPQEQETPRVE